MNNKFADEEYLLGHRWPLELSHLRDLEEPCHNQNEYLELDPIAF